MSIRDALRWACCCFVQGTADSETHLPDAEALLCHSTGKSSASLIADATQQLSAAQIAKFKSAVARRVRGEPIAYLIGQQEFWSLPLSITSDVLIPRAESELLVELVLAQAARHKPTTLLELGTGSGAIILALASEIPHCQMVASDIESRAIALAKHNQQKLRLAHIDFCVGAWFEPVAQRRFDIIVSNPPYVAAGDPHLQRGDLRFEPNSALVSPTNGFADLSHIISHAQAHLQTGGHLFLEHGYAQGAAIRSMFQRNGFTAVTTHCDLSGLERVTQGQANYF